MSSRLPAAHHDPTRAVGSRRLLCDLPHFRVALLALLSLLVASRTSAQFTQYIAPGSLGTAPPDLEERLEKGAADARWRFGRLRVDPLLYLRELGYQDNVFGATDDEEKVSDYRAQVAAGLNAYLPLGPKAMFSAFITPEYSWWAERGDLDQFNLSAGTGLFGFFNRMTVSLDGRRIEQESILNAELSVPVTLEEERLSLGVEVELRRSLAVFAALRSSKFRNSGAAAEVLPELRLEELDRDFDSERAGLRLHLGENLALGVGLEESENDFLVDPGQRSSNGTSPFADLRLEGNRINAQLTVLETELDFADGSPLTSFNSTTGTGRVLVTSPRGFATALYASRNVVFSARETDSLYLENRLGLSVGRDERRLNWLVFLESGELDFRGGDNEQRIDDVTAYGVNVGLDLSDDLAVVLVFEETRFESNQPQFDRSSSGFGVRLAFRDNLFPF